MFKLNKREFSSLRSQIVTSTLGGRQYKPYVFTEHGILMLSSVLRSDTAALVNIQIMRSFAALRRSLVNYQQLKEKLDEEDRKVIGFDTSV
jgi:hypothetical protein